MQTVLFITNCSVDATLSLRTWLAANAHQPLRLTVVHPYDIPAGERLHKSICKPAKANAQARLARWAHMLGEVDTTYMTTNVLFASLEQALTIHRLTRKYDHWFVDECTVIDTTPIPCQVPDNERILL